MRPDRTVPVVLIIAGLAVFVSLACAAGEPMPATPYSADPVLREMMDAVTFYHSFDNDSLVPDMAVGDWQGKRFGEPKLAPGLRGSALVAGNGALLFADPRNWTITTRGALAVWVASVTWDHEHAGNTNFVLSSSSALYLERQGPEKSPDKGWIRLEALLVGLQRGPTGSVGAGCSKWQPGEWHLVAVNWSWPQLAMSVDGSEFEAVQLREKPAPGLFGGLMVGSQGGDPTLLDEFLCLHRPLSQLEVRTLFERLRPSATGGSQVGGQTK